jgi:hypothetical protein
MTLHPLLFYTLLSLSFLFGMFVMALLMAGRGRE